MFSEYASRFLAQSQSRFSNFAGAQPDNAEPARPQNPNDRYRRANQPYQNSSRRYPSRHGNPYQSANLSTIGGFTTRYTAPDAPLFHSALDEFREEDDEEERERETADFFALQKSRRTFAPIQRLEESSETDPEASNASLEQSKDEDGRAVEDRGRGRGIKSSWNGGGRSYRERGRTPGAITEETDPSDKASIRAVSESSKGKDKMVDVGLESTIEDDDPPDDLMADMRDDESVPAFQNFRPTGPKAGAIRLPTDSKHERDREAAYHAGAGIPRPPSSVETVPATIATTLGEAPKHDIFFGSLYLICLGGLFATFFLIFLHTETPSKVIGDTIYSTLHASMHLFAVDTVVSIFVSLVWLALLRSFVRTLVHLILLAVPVILISFSLYPFVSSYKGTEAGMGLQDKVMRWLSFIPAILALVWLYTIYRGRHSLNKAIGILEFASRILAANPALLGLGFATLASVVVWTWLWLGMFTRVFLGGHLTTATVTKFIIDATSWWLAVYFVLMYIWTLSVISGIQRSTTAATVSQWYFHRNVQPNPTSREIVAAAFSHATTTLFGTISLSTLIALLIRLPLLVLPSRLMSIVSIFFYTFIPTPIVALTNPLTLTYAAIHSQPLHLSARGLSQMAFLAPNTPTTTLTPRSFKARNQGASLLPYRLSKLLLHATRFIMATALGFGGWVATARQLDIAMPGGKGIRGSAYAYVVGLVASFIGWGVLGAMEGVLSGIVDASVVCWGSEKGMAGGGAYCLEAGYLFGEGRERDLP
ncbi:related to choline transporter-like protein [Phialocephala subalpina]|uniref:Protein PNS1 n=1 Tax=Phialocephala subalpina TaxID=576137 RepID=A0A1L7WMS0_9HELO|nr:related to choline transporter-like protein [Phialocephala subalpina]